MIKVMNNTIIYVLCPAYTKTGGPELLHQLVFELNNQGKNAYITYYDYNENENYTDSAFKKYIKDYKLIEQIEDSENNIIIFPETYYNNGNYLKSKKVIWWLSVDNFLKGYRRKNPIKLIRFIKEANKNINRTDYHLCQSYYAMHFLSKRKIKNIGYLSDYINDIYFEDQFKKEIYKEDNILYNPKKGFKFTKELIKRYPNLNWIPIQNLTNEQVRELLLRSKVYIDFGNHPGKDRFPREAAISNCCIITNKRGAAKYNNDVPIPERFKFEDKKKNIPQIISCIENCLKNYDEEIKQFEEYRTFISKEKDMFKKTVSEIFN